MSGPNVASRLLQSSGEFQRTGVTKRDPEIQALLSKLVPDVTVNSSHYVEGPDRQRRIVGPDVSMLERISETTATNIIDAQNLLQTLPDVEMAMQVTVSAILAPKDLIETTINWRVEPGWIPSELSLPMLNVVKDYFDNSYKISEKLPDILKDILYLRGSRPILLLPESSIDHLINSNDRISNEAFASYMSSDKRHFRSLGFLGNRSKTDDNESELSLETIVGGKSKSKSSYNPSVESLTISMEFQLHEDDIRESSNVRHKKASVNFDPKLSITDNPQVLLIPQIQEKVRRDRVHDIVRPKGFGVEAFDPNPVNNGTSIQSGNGNLMNRPLNSIYRPRQFNAAQTLAVSRASQLTRESIGHPSEFHLPSECVIPVHTPSNPENHIGYFILLDRNGQPLIKTTETDYFNEMAYNLKQNRTLTDQMITNVGRHNNPNADWYTRQVDVDEMTRVYSEVMEMELTQRLRNGIYGGDLKVSRPQEIYQIMFARALAGMHTQLLYVPAELITYMAFDYNQYGIGVSLLQRSKILGGLRAIMLYASIMAGIKNSIGNTVVDIELDEEDPDPQTSLETIMHEFAYGRSAGMMPLGTTRPRDIVNYMKQASVQYSVSGNPRLPTVKVSVEDKPTNRVKPESELVEDLKKNHLASLGVPAESVDAAQGPDFATTVLSNNLMFAKRVMIYQKMLMGFMQDHVARYTLNSSVLMQRLREIVESNKQELNKHERPEDSESIADLAERGIDSYAQNNTNEIDSVILDFISALRMELPKPDQASKRLKKEEFDNEVQMIESALKYYIDADFLRSLELGDLESDLDAIIAGVRSHFIRDWMRTENIMPSLNILTEMDGDEPAMDLLKSQAAHVDLLRRSIGTYVLKVTRDLKAWTGEVKDIEEEAGADSNSSSSFDSSSSDDNDTDTSGDDGAGFGDDTNFGMDTGEEGGDGTEDNDSNTDAGTDENDSGDETPPEVTI